MILNKKKKHRFATKKYRLKRNQFPQDIKEKNYRSKEKKKNQSRIIPKITPSGLGLQKSKRNDDHNPNGGCLESEKMKRKNSANEEDKLFK